ncbi:Hypothetical protein LUCI_3400 [Lucifera butyrica]|uniref:Prepilin-type N-terminal cleavage/methylation domain-containing protein n=1 Tax=Lucifera butyrica TaxID=1351585 RepID=A0A498RAW4_9FIRM|nr:hypothetical protein [Lucifera butyrica]VBB08135.1 Hypothetical protein LUCI_3400 [Lucifera butyrica]
MNNKGFTLVEFIVWSAMAVLISVGIISLFASIVKSYQYSYEQGSNAQDAQNILNLITNELRNAASITNLTNTEVDYTTSVNGTTENRKIYLGSGNNAHTIIYAVNNTITKELGVDRVKEFNFDPILTSNNKKEIKITLTMQNQQNSNLPLVQLSDTVVTLNDM